MQTERLTLRPLTLRDAPRIAALAGDWDVARMTGRLRYPYSLVDADQWIGAIRPNELVRAVIWQKDLIGVVGYMADDEGFRADLGFWIGKQYWGQGFATEAARAVLEHGFRVHRLRQMVCSHFHDNDRSRRVIEKLGFCFTGRLRLWCEARQSDIEALSYVRLHPEFAPADEGSRT